MNKKQFLDWLGPNPENLGWDEKAPSNQLRLFTPYRSYLETLGIPVPYAVLDERFLGEGDWGGEQYIVYRFDCSDGPLWIKLCGFYRSYDYDSEQYTHYKVVTPQEKLVTVYE